jgi:adenosylcobinamide-phosphate synthase
MGSEFFLVLFTAILIDLALGELPSPIHPVVLMGKFIEIIKVNFLTNSTNQNRIIGILMTFLLVIVFSGFFTVILFLSQYNNIFFLIVASILLSTTFAIKSLLKSVYNIYVNILNDLDKGRKSLSFLVSRKTENLSLSQVVSASIETLTENITDSVIAPLFYAFLFGLLAVFIVTYTNLSGLNFFSSSYTIIVIGVIAGVTYRVVNTLDAMVGYKDDENIDIGWFPARTDDYLNYIPARLTGILLVISSFFIRSNYKRAWQVMLMDAHKTPSPNSGYPMAAAAGALNVQLEKPETYTLGKPGTDLTPVKIIEALKLTSVTITLFLLIIIIIFSILFLI